MKFLCVILLRHVRRNSCLSLHFICIFNNVHDKESHFNEEQNRTYSDYFHDLLKEYTCTKRH
jgi:hypothetical protein